MAKTSECKYSQIKLNIIQRLALKILAKSQGISLLNNTFYKHFNDWINNVLSPQQVNTGYISACANVWGLSFSKAIFRLYDEEESDAEVTRHPILDLLTKPNYFQTGWELKFRWALDLIWEGNSYLLKLRDSLGVPRSVVQLHPERVMTYPYNLERIDYYQYNTGSQLLELPREDIIHFRYPDQTNYIKGIPLVAKIGDLKDIENMQMEYRKQFYKQGGFLGATFTTDQALGKSSFERAKQMLEENYTGSTSNAFKVALFEQGLKPIATAYSPKDMQLTNERQLNRDEICAAFGVNKLLLGQSELIQRGNADTIYYVFYSLTIDPLLNYFDEALTTQLAKQDFADKAGYSPYYIKHDKLAARDTETDLKYYENGLQYGWMLPSEVRQEEGFDTNDELDRMYMESKIKN